MKEKIVHLLSGGIDSVVMLYDLHGNDYLVHPLLFDYKQRHVQELIWAKHHCQQLNLNYTTIELPQLKGSNLTDGEGGIIIPNRNAILLSFAVNLAVTLGAQIITFAANADDHEVFHDCRSDFVRAFNELINQAGYPIKVLTPYLYRSKGWITKHGQKLGVRFNETWSCYQGGLKPCGKCEACQKREAALNQL